MAVEGVDKVAKVLVQAGATRNVKDLVSRGNTRQMGIETQIIYWNIVLATQT